MIKTFCVDFKIDELNKFELEEMSSFLQLVWKNSFEDFLSLAPAAILFSTTKLQEMMDTPDCFVRVARSLDSQLLGFICFSKCEIVVHIKHLYVHPNFQKGGIGTKLFNTAVNYFPDVEKCRLQVFAKNQLAQQFYSKLGCHSIGNRMANFGTEKTPAILMEKTL